MNPYPHDSILKKEIITSDFLVRFAVTEVSLTLYRYSRESILGSERG